MRSNEIKRVRDGIFAEIQNKKANYCEVASKKVATINAGDEETATNVFAEVITAVQTIIKGVYVESISLPECLVKFTTEVEDGKVVSFNLSIRSKLRASYKVKEEYVIANDANLVSAVFDAFVSALYIMLDIELAKDNLAVLNNRVLEICAKNDIPCMFSFDCNPDAGVIISIDNEHIIFNVDSGSAHDVIGLPIFSAGDSYSDYVRENAEVDLVDSLKTAQTTVQLIKSNVKVIKNVVGIATKKRASKLIRTSYHKNARFLSNQKAGIGYFDEVVSINGEDVKVFALVEKTEDGEMKVILNPFDVTTNMNVDFDVLGALK